MQRNETGAGAGAARRTLALISLLAFTMGPAFCAASPEPLPPPAELLDGVPAYAPSGPSINIGYGQGRPANGQGYSPIGQQPAPMMPSADTGRDVYDPYGTPVSSYLPPLPGQPESDVGSPYATQSPWPVPPGGQQQYANRPPMVISPPASNMPDEYFNLPFPVMEAPNIPGVLMPELDEDFYDPGLGAVTKRPIRLGMSQRQLEPFFELAKGFEKNALTAKEQNDGKRYLDDLKRAIDGYMEIIAMADASHEAREEAWYGVARCEYRRENWWKAFDALERSFPSKYDKREVEGRIKLEMFLGERLWRLGHNVAPDARKDGTTLTGYQAASRVYAAAIFNQPNAKDAPLALLRRGDAAAMDRDWKEAAKFYRTVVQYYPESEPAMQARSSLAESVYRQEWPAGFPEAARQDLASVMTPVEGTERKLSGPAEERRQRAVTMANTHEAELKLRQAKDYMKNIRVKKSRDAVVFQLGEIVSHYPNTPQAREAADLLIEMGIDPPMVLSDGSRYPIPSSGASMLDRVSNQSGVAGGSVRVDRQVDRRGGVLAPNGGRAQEYSDEVLREQARREPRRGDYLSNPGMTQNMARGRETPQTPGWPSAQINMPPRPGVNAPQGGGFSPVPWSTAGQQGSYSQPGQYRDFGQQRSAPLRVNPRAEDVTVPGIAPEWE